MPPELTAALALCRNLPSPPGIALRIIELAQDPEADITTAADIIAIDMALSARMLRIANSPLYASRRRIENLGQALTMLGLNATVSLALGFTVTQGLTAPGAGQDLRERAWRRSILSALAASLLGQARGLRKAEELMLAGLLQDLGILVLAQAQPDTYLPLLRQAADNDALVALEREHLHCTHAEVGALMAEQWDLPRYLVDSIARSESPADAEDNFQTCVALSGAVADIWLSADADAAREHALQLVNERLQLDSAQFDQVLARISDALPDISALFETSLLSPSRVQQLIDHAQELATLRNLREMQDAAQARQRADEFEAGGNIDASAEWLRKSGLAKADKKADRVAAEGIIVAAQDGNKAVLVEVNSETDFVAKDSNFLDFTKAVGATALSSGAADIDALKAAKLPTGETIEEARAAVIAKVGEKVDVRRIVRLESTNNVAAYVHGGRIGVLVELAGGDAELARGLAMHVAAMNPPHNKAADVPAEFVAKEKEIELAKMTDKDKSKPADILEKIISGKIAKIVNEVTLYGQPYVLDTNQSVEQVLKAAGADVVGFKRLAVGEGIEKVVEDYAAEVMKQAGLA